MMNISAAACVVFLVPLVATAAPDAREGRRLVQSNKCEACHQEKVYGPVGSIYLRKDRKVTSWAKLNAQVTACNTMLTSGLFPEEEAHIVAFLNETYYKLPLK